MSIEAGARGHVFTLASIVANAPAASGIYALFDTDWVFFGESANIRGCLLIALSAAGTCRLQHATGFAFELAAAGERGARCAELNRFYSPPCRHCPESTDERGAKCLWTMAPAASSAEDSGEP